MSTTTPRRALAVKPSNISVISAPSLKSGQENIVKPQMEFDPEALNKQTLRENLDAEAFAESRVASLKRDVISGRGHDGINKRLKVEVYSMPAAYVSDDKSRQLGSPNKSKTVDGGEQRASSTQPRHSDASALSASASPSSSFASDVDHNDSQDTVITQPDVAATNIAFVQPIVSPPPPAPRKWSAVETKEAAEKLRLTLQYVRYKAETNQVERSFDQVEIRHRPSASLSSTFPPNSATSSFNQHHLFAHRTPLPTAGRPTVSGKTVVPSATFIPGKKPIFSSERITVERPYGKINSFALVPPPANVESDTDNSDDESLPNDIAAIRVKEAKRIARMMQKQEGKEQKEREKTLEKLKKLPAKAEKAQRKEYDALDVTSSAVKSANLLTSFREGGSFSK